MNKLILIALLAGATALAQTAGQGAAQAKAAPSKAKVLNRAEFDELMSHPDRVLLLDLRRPDEVSTNGGFPVYLSIQIGEIEKHLSEIPKDRTIITVSNHANRRESRGRSSEQQGIQSGGRGGSADLRVRGWQAVEDRTSEAGG